jgi:hypothetical protein
MLQPGRYHCGNLRYAQNYKGGTESRVLLDLLKAGTGSPIIAYKAICSDGRKYFAISMCRAFSLLAQLTDPWLALMAGQECLKSAAAMTTADKYKEL